MTTYLIELTCPRCGGELDHVNTSRPWRSDELQAKDWNSEISAVCRCPNGHGEVQLIVMLRRMVATDSERRRGKARNR